MTPLPKRRHSTRRQGKRTRALRVTTSQKSACSNCGAQKQSHSMCPLCGYYNGKLILAPRIKKKKRE